MKAALLLRTLGVLWTPAWLASVAAEPAQVGSPYKNLATPQFQNNERFPAGEVRTLADSGDSAEALRERIMAAEQLGAAHEALAIAEQHPGLIDAEQTRRLQGSDAAQLVRFGALDPASVSTRFAVTDAAIAELDRQIARPPEPGREARDARLRARLDRLVALRDRGRMREVTHEYEALCIESVTVPAYVLTPVADAYIYLQRPDTARTLYERALALAPDNFETRVKLFYALIDTNQFDSATRLIDSLNQQQPTWIWLKGLKSPIPNPKREITEQLVAEARLYSDALPAAERLFTALSEAAPQNPGYRLGLADTYAARGWPRRARTEFEIARVLDPSTLSPRVRADTAANELTLQRYRQAATTLEELVREFPESVDVRRARRELSLYQLPEVSLGLTRTYAPASSVKQGNALVADIAAYSTPLRYHWRLFAGAGASRETDAQGDITLRQTRLGIEYRASDLSLRLAGTRNSYTVVRGGAVLESIWRPGDTWQVEGKAATFSEDTPLRALLHGVTASSGEINLTYRGNEMLSARVGMGLMGFSDGNRAAGVKANLTRRVYSAPLLQIDTTADLAGSRNSLPRQAYYSPAHDLESLLGLGVTRVLCRRYEYFLKNRLTFQAGLYSEQGFGSHATEKIGDTLTWHSSKALQLDLGLAYSRSAYDGIGQNGFSVAFNVDWRY